MMDRTIVYVSSNREDPEFEKRIQADLLEKAGDIPIVSVTQAPTNLGTNICVGDVGTSGYNFCRQVLIGCEAATTPIVIAAESDCVYPEEYFKFTPPKLDRMYRCSNIAVLKYQQGFYKKDSSTFASVCGREWYIQHLKDHFAARPNARMWDETLKSWPTAWGRKFLDSYETFDTQYAAISFKTGRGMRLHTRTFKDELDYLPGWGTVEEFRKKYL